MSWRREWTKIQSLFGRSHPADDLAEEIRAHLSMEERENRDSGMSSEEARYSAKKRFGNVTTAAESSREAWSWRLLDLLAQDVRFALRQLRHNLSFTTVAVLTFALGIGATTAVFSVVHAVLLRPLPFHQPDRLVALFDTEKAPGDYPLSGADYLDWQAQNRTLDATSVYSWPSVMSASSGADPESVAVVNVQANLFDVLGVGPLIGRKFSLKENTAGNNQVAILSYGFWQQHFGGRGIVGRNIVLNGKTYGVVGVMPRSFRFSAKTDLWIPLDMSSQTLGQRGTHQWNAIGRLKTSVTLGQVREDLLAISKRLEKQYPDSNTQVHAVVTPLAETLTEYSKTPLLILLGAVTLLLLVACGNVANLQLARASTRHREMAVRSSLGAGRSRLLQQMLTESVLLALLGAAIGVVVAWWCVRLLQSVKSLPIPLVNPIQVDGSVLLFAIAVSVAAGVLFGLAPALQGSEQALNVELRAGAQSVVSVARSRQILRDALVVSEMSLTLALLVGAGLLLRSFEHLRRADIGVDPHNVLTTFINLPEAKYPGLPARRQFFDQLLSRVRSSSGIEIAALSSEIPLQGGNNGYIHADGKPDPALSSQLVGWNFITPEYFRTMGIPLVKGRGIDDTDIDRAAVTSQHVADLVKQAAPAPFKMPPDVSFVAVISRKMALTFWHNEDPLGRSFHWNDMEVTVVGVVGDVSEYGIRAQPMPQAYLPLTFALAFNSFAHVTVKTRTTPETAAPLIRRQVRALDAALAPSDPQTMDEVVSGDTQDASLQTFLLGIFALLALALAAVGLYGVMSYLVSQRTREIGIRIALGAERRNVLSLVMRRGAKLTLLGILLGGFAALALTRLMSSVLYNVSSTDPLTFAAVTVVLVVVASLAYFIPARRAATVDPIRALRYE